MNYGDTRPEVVYERLHYYYLKNMFEPDERSIEWKKLLSSTVQKWYLYQSCGVHLLSCIGVNVYMLVEKDYVINNSTSILYQMLQPGKLTLQRPFDVDTQAKELIEKYKKLLESKVSKQ